MQLHRENAFSQRDFVVVVREVQDQRVVEVVLDVIAIRDDHNIIPIVELEELLEPRLIDQARLDELLLTVRLPGSLFTDQTDATALTALVVNETTDVWQLVLIAEFVLIAANDPLIVDLAVSDVLRAILNSGVVGRVATKRQPQLEILQRAVLPNEEGVPLGRILGSRLAMNHSVLNAPQSRITVPGSEILAVKQSLHPRHLRRSRYRSVSP